MYNEKGIAAWQSLFYDGPDGDSHINSRSDMVQ